MVPFGLYPHFGRNTMLTALALSLVLAAPHNLHLPTLPTGCSASTTILGFSENEHAIALKRQISCAHADGDHDVFALIDLFDSEKGLLKATFRTSLPKRLDRAGHVIFVAPKLMSRADPPYAQAHEASMWNKLERQGHFSRIQHTFENQMVRFVFFGVDGTVDSHQGTAEVVGAAHQPLNFDVLVRLASGEDDILGHIQHGAPTSKKVPKAHVRVAYSHLGHVVALVVSDLGPTRVFVDTTELTDSVGSIKMGAANVIQATPDALEDDFLASHPYAKDTWKHFIRNNM